MANRPERWDINLAICKVISLRAVCQRGKVGCVITKHHRIISSGYNGPLLGKTCNQANCDIESKCQHAVHAELNAIAAAAREGISLDGATLYCTHGPCYDCAKVIIQSGITQVVYTEDYKNELGVDLINNSSVNLLKVTYSNHDNLYDQIKDYSLR
jgi:dCMP deaminase